MTRTETGRRWTYAPLSLSTVKPNSDVQHELRVFVFLLSHSSCPFDFDQFLLPLQLQKNLFVLDQGMSVDFNPQQSYFLGLSSSTTNDAPSPFPCSANLEAAVPGSGTWTQPRPSDMYQEA